MKPAFIFDFVAGNFYVINFSRVDGSGLGQMGTHYSWENVGSYVPYDYGVLTLLEGFDSAIPDPGNPLIPWARFSDEPGAVPSAPATAPVPTLSEWALIVFFMLPGLTVFTNRRRLF